MTTKKTTRKNTTRKTTKTTRTPRPETTAKIKRVKALVRTTNLGVKAACNKVHIGYQTFQNHTQH